MFCFMKKLSVLVFVLALLCFCTQPVKKSDSGLQDTVAPADTLTELDIFFARQDSLFAAVHRSDTAAISALISRGADVNYRDEYGFYVLYWAQDSRDEKVISTLLRHGARDFNAESKRFFDLCRQGNLPAIKLLVNNGLDVNERFVWYKPSHEDASCDCYMTGLAVAAEEGHLELVKYLLDKGAIVSFDYNGVQPISRALQNRHYDVANLLLRKGADRSVTFVLDMPHYYYYPNDSVHLTYLLDNNFPYIEDSSRPVSPLMKVSAEGNIFALSKLARLAEDWQLDNALCYAKNLQTARVLVQQGARATSVYQFIGEGGCHDYSTPMLAAVRSGDTVFVQYILSRGGQINTKIDDYLTPAYACALISPLVAACEQNDTVMTGFLLRKGAETNHIVRMPWEEDAYISPLIVAIKNNNPALVGMLFSRGAKIYNRGVSAYDYVISSTNAEVVALLDANQ